MSNPFTEIDRVQELIEKTIPCHGLLQKEHFNEFIFIASTSPYAFMLQDMRQTKPAYVCSAIYTFMGYEQDEENLPSFETLLHHSGCFKRYGEYCDNFKVMSSDDFSTTFALKTKSGTVVHILMLSRALPFFNASGAMVLSVFILCSHAHDDKTVLSLPTKNEKQFYERFRQLDKRDKDIVKLLVEGKTHEEVGAEVLLSKHGIKARKNKILEQLGISLHELKNHYSNIKKFRNRV